MNTKLCKECKIKIEELNYCKSNKNVCKNCYNKTKRLRNAIYRELNRDKLNEKGKIYRENK